MGIRTSIRVLFADKEGAYFRGSLLMILL